MLKTPQSPAKRDWRGSQAHSNCAKRLDCGAFTAAVARDWSSLPRGQFSAAWHWQAGFAEGQRNGGSLAK
jgi:hypothetical protein